MMRFFTFCLFLSLIISCQPVQQEKTAAPFIKGVYGNPGTLLQAGYAFDSLGMNAVFVRSISLTPEFFQTAKQQGCNVYVEFPTLNGKEYLKEHPDAWPLDETGAPSPAADWFMGICPTHPGFKNHRIDELKTILNAYKVDGIFLDYLHWHAQFETPHPILPETCFCNRCLTLFAAYIGQEIPGSSQPEKANWILANQDNAWRSWRNSILNGWVEELGDVLHQQQPKALLGAYYCAWYPEDHDEALYRTLGIDVAALAERTDVLAPMLFHRMKDRPVSWVGDYLEWLNELLQPMGDHRPQVWPIVQAHNNPGIISSDEFREVMVLGSQPPATGIMMFSDVSLLDNPEKITVMQQLYRHVLR
jgi:hypothetical protein